MFDQSDIPIISQEAYESDTYNDGPVKKVICFTFSTVQNGDHEKWKRDGNSDLIKEVDLTYLQKHFTNFYDGEVYIQKQLENFGNFSGLISSINRDILNQFECLFFIFLTYVTEDGKLKLCGGDMTLNEIVDEIKYLLPDRPKVVLVQADDVRLLEEKIIYKGPVKFVMKKVPTDGDVIQIVSNIPGEFARSSDKNGPSFLIKEFVGIMQENAKRPDESKDDLLSLTVDINQRIDAQISKIMEDKNLKGFPWERAPDLEVPLVTSTLKRKLIISGMI